MILTISDVALCFAGACAGTALSSLVTGKTSWSVGEMWRAAAFWLVVAVVLHYARRIKESRESRSRRGAGAVSPPKRASAATIACALPSSTPNPGR